MNSAWHLSVCSRPSLADREAFAAWKDPQHFARVRLGPGTSIICDDDINLCDDALYMQITGMTPEEMVPSWFDGAYA